MIDVSNNIGLRQNNPGNLKDPATGAFRTFSSVDEGNQALIDDLKAKQSGQSDHIKPGAPLSQLAAVWAPASDKNDPVAYANTLATHLGVTPDTPFDQIPADKLAGAIRVAEGTSTPATVSQPTQKLSVKDFAQKIRDKYNAYQGVDDNTLVTKFLAKYPVYQDRVDMTPSSSIPPEAQQHVKDMMDQGKTHDDVQAYLQSVKSGAPAPASSVTTPAEQPFDYGSEVGKQFTAGGEHIVSSVEGGAQKISEGMGEAETPGAGVGARAEGLTKAAEGGAQSFLGTFGGALQTVLSPVTPVISKVVSDLVKAHPDIANTVTKIVQPLSTLASQHPEEAGVIGDSINALLAVIGEKLGGEKIGIKGGGEEAATTATDATDMTDRIMPKPTQRESQLALREGRLVPGGKGGLFSEGTEGKILPTEKQIQAGKDIISEIPGASKMSDQELFTATKNYVATESKRLYPELEKVTIKPEDFDKAINAAEELQKVHAKQTSLLSPRNLQKIQDNFEEALFNLEGKTGADVWDATKAYDDTFKGTIKNATKQSSDLAQEEKDLWLSNRRILMELRDATGEQLEGGSKDSFRKMSNMYEAQRGLLTEAKSSLKPQPSRFSAWKTAHPGTVKTAKIIRTVGEIGAGGAVIKNLLK